MKTFRKAKLRIALTIVAILAVLLVVILTIIYLRSYHSVQKENYDFLDRMARIHYEKLTGSEPDDDQGNRHGGSGKNNGKGSGKEIIYSDSMIICISVDENGNTTVLDNHGSDLYDAEELSALALSVKGSTRGQVGELLYSTAGDNPLKVIAFMDNTAFSQSFSALFHNTLLFGAIGLVLVFFISLYLAGRIVKPMQESYEKQKEFTADAGHELKTPIAAISANAELLKREIGGNRWLENIISENERMGELTKGLLELARSEGTRITREPLDLTHLVNGCVLPLEASAFEKGVRFEVQAQEGITVTGDKGQLQQLVTILLDNALYHAGDTAQEERVIDVDLRRIKRQAVLTITNPGAPISAEEQERIFERFYRQDEARTYTGHYGLGLAIARAIARSHGGEISISCSDGKVSFIITLPEK